MKKNIGFLIALFAYFGAFASTVTFQNENYSGTVTYNETASPGDAIFAKMNLKIAKNIKRKNTSEIKAVLTLFKNEKKSDNAQFYYMNPKAKKTQNIVMIASIPVSLWTDFTASYTLKIIFDTGIDNAKEITLPILIEERNFPKEVLNLDSKNSAIKQNMSAERIAQIEKLNNILSTINDQNVFSLKPFVRPVKSERMTAHYGDKRVYKYIDGTAENSQHYGHDYGVPEGTEVFACSEGRVVMAEFRISTGWSVVIEHLPGLYSLYYHMSRLDVKEGDYVKQSEKIGLSGSTGLATGPHLHWEVRLNMAAVTPDFFTKEFVNMEN